MAQTYEKLIYWFRVLNFDFQYSATKILDDWVTRAIQLPNQADADKANRNSTLHNKELVER